MIAWLKGEILSVGAESCVMVASGVGYEGTCSANTLAEVDSAESAELFIHTHVREDQISLFGFTSQVEKKLFLSLLKVNGIGPKLAITILSAAKVADIVELIENSDAKGLAKLPRIGKKTAEQMILSLKGQLVVEEKPAEVIAKSQNKEVVSALVNLGFRVGDVEEVVEQLEPGMDLQDSIRKGLSLLTN